MITISYLTDINFDTNDVMLTHINVNIYQGFPLARSVWNILTQTMNLNDHTSSMGGERDPMYIVNINDIPSLEDLHTRCVYEK